jgi:hypothetical protein
MKRRDQKQLQSGSSSGDNSNSKDRVDEESQRATLVEMTASRVGQGNKG